MKPATTIVLGALAAAMLAVSLSRAESKDGMTLGSDAFQDGQSIPVTNTCDGDDISPALHWDGAPPETAAFALLVDDPDAPHGNWNHWVLFNVPKATRALAPGMALESTLGDGSRQGTNDFGRVGYGGPCPPKGSAHHYEFRLFALSAPLELKAGAKREAVLEAVKQSTLAKAKLVGRYQRLEK